MNDVCIWLATYSWDSFLPDLVVGVVTGLVVGLALLLLQRRGERLTNERELRRQWDALRPQLAPLFHSGTVSREAAAQDLSYPVGLTRNIEVLLRDKPTQIWAQTLKTSELRDLHQFYATWNALSYTSGALSELLYKEIAARIPLEAGMLGPRARAQLAFIERRIVGIEPKKDSDPTIKEDHSITDAVLASPEVASLAEVYRADLDTIIATSESLARRFSMDARRPRSEI